MNKKQLISLLNGYLNNDIDMKLESFEWLYKKAIELNIVEVNDIDIRHTFKINNNKRTYIILEKNVDYFICSSRGNNEIFNISFDDFRNSIENGLIKVLEVK